MKTDLKKIYKLFEAEEERRHKEQRQHPDTMFEDKSSNPFKDQYDNFLKLYEDHVQDCQIYTGDNVSGIEKYNLSLEEASLIYMYTVDVCFEVNQQLRERPEMMDKDYEEYSQQLNFALDKLPSYDNKTVYRDVKSPVKSPEHYLNWHKERQGEIVKQTAFMSSHIEKEQWRQDNTGFSLIIHTKLVSNGKHIGELTFNTEEKEVLFKTNTEYRILNVDYDTAAIEVQEV